ncbi:TFIIB-type zinc ribbon-containing protein [Klebsiella pneumoniae subsp. pneumoniae]|nr:TFIIB-type zinc ribbon-containing protein [Klebsiella pneumoniae subsp. pneumoniae]
MSKLTTMKVACPDCGSEMLKRPDVFDFDTNFVGVSCANCGREITKDDVVKQGTDVVKSRLTTSSGDAFKGTGWKLR